MQKVGGRKEDKKEGGQVGVSCAQLCTLKPVVEHLPKLAWCLRDGKRFPDTHKRKTQQGEKKGSNDQPITITSLPSADQSNQCQAPPLFPSHSRKSYILCEPLVHDSRVNRVDVPTRRRDAALQEGKQARP